MSQSGIKNTTGYVNYVYNLSARGSAQVLSSIAGMSGQVGSMLGQLAFQTQSVLSATEGTIVALGTAAVAGFTEATKRAMEFDYAMKEVRAIAGKDANIGAINSQAVQLSNQYGMALSDVTDGLITLGRAGLKGDSMTKVLQEGFKLSKLEALDLNYALESLISTTNLLDTKGISMNDEEYGKAVEEMNNLIVSTSEVSPLDARDIINTMQHAGGYVQTTGMDQKDVFAVIAQLGSVGTKGEIAGTALRAFMSAGQKDTGQRALERIGLNVNDLWGENGETMMSITDMKDLIDSQMEAKGYSKQEKLEFYSDFVGYKQANQIMKIDTDSVAQYREEMDKSESVTEKVSILLGTAQQNLKSIAQIAGNFLMKVGSNTLKFLNPALVVVKSLLDFITSIPGIDILGGFALATLSIKALLTMFNKITPMMLGQENRIDKSSNSMNTFGKIANTVKGAVTDIRKELQTSSEIIKAIIHQDWGVIDNYASTIKNSIEDINTSSKKKKEDNKSVSEDTIDSSKDNQKQSKTNVKTEEKSNIDINKEKVFDYNQQLTQIIEFSKSIGNVIYQTHDSIDKYGLRIAVGIDQINDKINRLIPSNSAISKHTTHLQDTYAYSKTPCTINLDTTRAESNKTYGNCLVTVSPKREVGEKKIGASAVRLKLNNIGVKPFKRQMHEVAKGMGLDIDNDTVAKDIIKQIGDMNPEEANLKLIQGAKAYYRYENDMVSQLLPIVDALKGSITDTGTMGVRDILKQLGVKHSNLNSLESKVKLSNIAKENPEAQKLIRQAYSNPDNLTSPQYRYLNDMNTLPKLNKTESAKIIRQISQLPREDKISESNMMSLAKKYEEILQNNKVDYVNDVYKYKISQNDVSFNNKVRDFLKLKAAHAIRQDNTVDWSELSRDQEIKKYKKFEDAYIDNHISGGDWVTDFLNDNNMTPSIMSPRGVIKVFKQVSKENTLQNMDSPYTIENVNKDLSQLPVKNISETNIKDFFNHPSILPELNKIVAGKVDFTKTGSNFSHQWAYDIAHNTEGDMTSVSDIKKKQYKESANLNDGILTEDNKARQMGFQIKDFNDVITLKEIKSKNTQGEDVVSIIPTINADMLTIPKELGIVGEQFLAAFESVLNTFEYKGYKGAEFYDTSIINERINDIMDHTAGYLEKNILASKYATNLYNSDQLTSLAQSDNPQQYQLQLDDLLVKGKLTQSQYDDVVNQLQSISGKDNVQEAFDNWKKEALSVGKVRINKNNDKFTYASGPFSSVLNESYAYQGQFGESPYLYHQLNEVFKMLLLYAQELGSERAQKYRDQGVRAYVEGGARKRKLKASYKSSYPTILDTGIPSMEEVEILNRARATKNGLQTIDKHDEFDYYLASETPIYYKGRQIGGENTIQLIEDENGNTIQAKVVPSKKEYTSEEKKHLDKVKKAFKYSRGSAKSTNLTHIGNPLYDDISELNDTDSLYSNPWFSYFISNEVDPTLRRANRDEARFNDGSSALTGFYNAGLIKRKVHRAGADGTAIGRNMGNEEGFIISLLAQKDPEFLKTLGVEKVTDLIDGYGDDFIPDDKGKNVKVDYEGIVTKINKNANNIKKQYAQETTDIKNIIDEITLDVISDVYTEGLLSSIGKNREIIRRSQATHAIDRGKGGMNRTTAFGDIIPFIEDEEVDIYGSPEGEDRYYDMAMTDIDSVIEDKILQEFDENYEEGSGSNIGFEMSDIMSRIEGRSQTDGYIVGGSKFLSNTITSQVGPDQQRDVDSLLTLVREQELEIDKIQTGKNILPVGMSSDLSFDSIKGAESFDEKLSKFENIKNWKIGDINPMDWINRNEEDGSYIQYDSPGLTRMRMNRQRVNSLNNTFLAVKGALSSIGMVEKEIDDLILNLQKTDTTKKFLKTIQNQNSFEWNPEKQTPEEKSSLQVAYSQDYLRKGGVDEIVYKKMIEEGMLPPENDDGSNDGVLKVIQKATETGDIEKRYVVGRMEDQVLKRETLDQIATMNQITKDLTALSDVAYKYKETLPKMARHYEALAKLNDLSDMDNVIDPSVYVTQYKKLLNRKSLFKGKVDGSLENGDLQLLIEMMYNLVNDKRVQKSLPKNVVDTVLNGKAFYQIGDTPISEMNQSDILSKTVLGLSLKRANPKLYNRAISGEMSLQDAVKQAGASAGGLENIIAPQTIEDIANIAHLDYLKSKHVNKKGEEVSLLDSNLFQIKTMADYIRKRDQESSFNIYTFFDKYRKMLEGKNYSLDDVNTALDENDTDYLNEMIFAVLSDKRVKKTGVDAPVINLSKDQIPLSEMSDTEVLLNTNLGLGGVGDLPFKNTTLALRKIKQNDPHIYKAIEEGKWNDPMALLGGVFGLDSGKSLAANPKYAGKLIEYIMDSALGVKNQVLKNFEMLPNVINLENEQIDSNDNNLLSNLVKFDSKKGQYAFTIATDEIEKYNKLISMLTGNAIDLNKAIKKANSDLYRAIGKIMNPGGEDGDSSRKLDRAWMTDESYKELIEKYKPSLTKEDLGGEISIPEDSSDFIKTYAKEQEKVRHFLLNNLDKGAGLSADEINEKATTVTNRYMVMMENKDAVSAQLVKDINNLQARLPSTTVSATNIPSIDLESVTQIQKQIEVLKARLDLLTGNKSLDEVLAIEDKTDFGDSLKYEEVKEVEKPKDYKEIKEQKEQSEYRKFMETHQAYTGDPSQFGGYKEMEDIREKTVDSGNKFAKKVQHGFDSVYNALFGYDNNQHKQGILSSLISGIGTSYFKVTQMPSINSVDDSDKFTNDNQSNESSSTTVPRNIYFSPFVSPDTSYDGLSTSSIYNINGPRNITNTIPNEIEANVIDGLSYSRSSDFNTIEELDADTNNTLMKHKKRNKIQNDKDKNITSKEVQNVFIEGLRDIKSQKKEENLLKMHNSFASNKDNNLNVKVDTSNLTSNVSNSNLSSSSPYDTNYSSFSLGSSANVNMNTVDGSSFYTNTHQKIRYNKHGGILNDEDIKKLVTNNTKAAKSMQKISGGARLLNQRLSGVVMGVNDLSMAFPPLYIAAAALQGAIGGLTLAMTISEGITSLLTARMEILNGASTFTLFGKAYESAGKLGRLVETVGAVITKVSMGVEAAISVLAPFAPIIAGVVVAIAALIGALKWSESSHQAYVDKLKEESKTRASASAAASENLKALKKKQENPHNNQYEQDKIDKKVALANDKLKSNNMKRITTGMEMGNAENDILWGQYGVRASFQKSLGKVPLIGGLFGGEYESTSENYDRTSSNTRAIVEHTVNNPFASAAERQVASYYNANASQFGVLEQYKNDFIKLYDKESSLVKKEGSTEAARSTDKWNKIISDFEESTGINRKQAEKYLDYMQTEHNVDQAKSAMKTQGDTIVADADMKATAIAMGGNVNDVLGLNGIEAQQKALVKANADILKEEVSTNLWWKAVWATIESFFWAIMSPITLIVNIVSLLSWLVTNLPTIIYAGTIGNIGSPIGLGLGEEDKQKMAEGTRLAKNVESSMFDIVGGGKAGQKAGTYWNAWAQNATTDYESIGNEAIDPSDRAGSPSDTGFGYTNNLLDKSSDASQEPKNINNQQTQNNGLNTYAWIREKTGNILPMSKQDEQQVNNQKAYQQQLDSQIKESEVIKGSDSEGIWTIVDVLNKIYDLINIIGLGQMLGGLAGFVAPMILGGGSGGAGGNIFTGGLGNILPTILGSKKGGALNNKITDIGKGAYNKASKAYGWGKDKIGDAYTRVYNWGDLHGHMFYNKHRGTIDNIRATKWSDAYSWGKDKIKGGYDWGKSKVSDAYDYVTGFNTGIPHNWGGIGEGIYNKASGIYGWGRDKIKGGYNRIKRFFKPSASVDTETMTDDVQNRKKISIVDASSNMESVATTNAQNRKKINIIGSVDGTISDIPIKHRKKSKNPNIQDKSITNIEAQRNFIGNLTTSHSNSNMESAATTNAQNTSGKVYRGNVTPVPWVYPSYSPLTFKEEMPGATEADSLILPINEDESRFSVREMGGRIRSKVSSARDFFNQPISDQINRILYGKPRKPSSNNTLHTYMGKTNPRIQNEYFKTKKTIEKKKTLTPQEKINQDKIDWQTGALTGNNTALTVARMNAKKEMPNEDIYSENRRGMLTFVPSYAAGLINRRKTKGTNDKSKAKSQHKRKRTPSDFPHWWPEDFLPQDVKDNMRVAKGKPLHTYMAKTRPVALQAYKREKAFMETHKEGIVKQRHDEIKRSKYYHAEDKILNPQAALLKNKYIGIEEVDKSLTGRIKTSFAKLKTNIETSSIWNRISNIFSRENAIKASNAIRTYGKKAWDEATRFGGFAKQAYNERGIIGGTAASGRYLQYSAGIGAGDLIAGTARKLKTNKLKQLSEMGIRYDEDNPQGWMSTMGKYGKFKARQKMGKSLGYEDWEIKNMGFGKLTKEYLKNGMSQAKDKISKIPSSIRKYRENNNVSVTGSVKTGLGRIKGGINKIRTFDEWGEDYGTQMADKYETKREELYNDIYPDGVDVDLDDIRSVSKKKKDKKKKGKKGKKSKKSKGKSKGHSRSNRSDRLMFDMLSGHHFATTGGILPVSEDSFFMESDAGAAYEDASVMDYFDEYDVLDGVEEYKESKSNKKDKSDKGKSGDKNKNKSKSKGKGKGKGKKGIAKGLGKGAGKAGAKLGAKGLLKSGAKLGLTALGTGGGWAAGATLGATLGSIVPGLGTAVGGFVGGMLGLAAESMLMDAAINFLFDPIGSLKGVGDAIGGVGAAIGLGGGSSHQRKDTNKLPSKGNPKGGQNNKKGKKDKKDKKDKKGADPLGALWGLTPIGFVQKAMEDPLGALWGATPLGFADTMLGGGVGDSIAGFFGLGSEDGQSGGNRDKNKLQNTKEDNAKKVFDVAKFAQKGNRRTRDALLAPAKFVDNLTGGMLSKTGSKIYNTEIGGVSLKKVADATGLTKTKNNMSKFLFGDENAEDSKKSKKDKQTAKADNTTVAEDGDKKVRDAANATSKSLENSKNKIFDTSTQSRSLKNIDKNTQEGNSSTVIIENININTNDDPESMKTALMNLIIELQEQTSPRMVSRTVGEPPSSGTSTQDATEENPEEDETDKEKSEDK